MIAAEAFKVYTVASYRHLHAVRLIQARMRRLQGLAVLDWTHEAPSLGAPLAERRRMLLVGRNCISAEQREAACAAADLMLNVRLIPARIAPCRSAWPRPSARP